MSSDWSAAAAPHWAPTRAEIQTWEPPAGVARGRGFAPAGRGRGIAKWSSQDDKPVGSSRHSEGPNGPDLKGRRVPGGGNRYQDGGGGSGDGRFDSAPVPRETRDTMECYRCEGIGHLSWECPSKDRSQRDDRRSEKKRDTGRERTENGTAYKEEGPRHRERDGGRGSRNETFECYKCNREGHIARNCPVRENGRIEEKVRSKGDECYTCGEVGHIARNCSSTGDSGKQRYAPRDEESEEELFQHGVSSGINFSRYDNIDVKVTGTDVREKVNSFQDANLHPVLMKNITKSNYSMPTPVQKRAIPNILAGRDLMACAQTGSGKTAAFLIPVINLLLEQGVSSERGGGRRAQPQVIVISPTRELAKQIKDEARKFSAGSGLKAVVAYGGTSLGEQANQLAGSNILIATPGRLLDYIDRDIVSLVNVKFLVLDEADRMLDRGFKDDINRLVRNPDMPGKRDRQTLMFSATFPDDIQRMASDFMDEYLFLTVGIVGGACRDVTQLFHQVSQFEKREQLVEVMNQLYQQAPATFKTLVFVEMKKTADFIASYMCQSGFPTTSIHGDRYQMERDEALRDFKADRKPVLVGTAVAARGLDIKNVEVVINYDLPKSINEYVHRIGRTGRLGNTGRAISFYDAASDSGIAADLVKILADAQQTVPDWLVSEARRNPDGLNGTAGRNFGGKDVRTDERTDREAEWS